MNLVRAMTRDPAKYKNPEEFDPDRFFDANNQLNNDDVTYAFGFGRRFVVCLLCLKNLSNFSSGFALAATWLLLR